MMPYIVLWIGCGNLEECKQNRKTHLSDRPSTKVNEESRMMRVAPHA
jgi:hypothetical protein